MEIELRERGKDATMGVIEVEKDKSVDGLWVAIIRGAWMSQLRAVRYGMGRIEGKKHMTERKIHVSEER